MTEYEAKQREADKRDAATLDTICKAGEELKLWTALPIDPQCHFPRRTLENADGLRFHLWLSNSGKASMCVASLEHTRNGVRVDPSDVRLDYNDTAPDAAASLSRGVSAVAKDLHRRVMNDPVAIGYAERVRAKMAERLKDRANLLTHIEAMRNLGFEFTQHRQLSDSETFETTMYLGGQLGSVRVNASGSVYVERGLSLSIENIGTLISILRK